MIDVREYEVLEHAKFSALSIGGSRVLKPGDRFRHNAWKWGEDTLNNAIETKRCKLVAGAEKYEVMNKEKKSSSDEIEKKKFKLEKMQEKYSSMDSEDPKAVKLLEKIKELEEELSL